MKSIFILIFSLWLMPVFAQQTPDTTAALDTIPVAPKYVEHSGRHLTLSADLYHPLINMFQTDKYGYEYSADYYMNRDLYFAFEGGNGGAQVNYNNLGYITRNGFIRAGINRSLLYRYDSSDWDNMFIGFRFGAASIRRSPSNYIVEDSLWGNSSGSTPSRNFAAAWVELLMAVRVQVVGNFSIGWNVRGKFMLNSRSFADLAPLYIAGYGRGDKNSAFDLDVYLSYSMSWKRKSQRIAAVDAKKGAK